MTCSTAFSRKSLHLSFGLCNVQTNQCHIASWWLMTAIYEVMCVCIVDAAWQYGWWWRQEWWWWWWTGDYQQDCTWLLSLLLFKLSLFDEMPWCCLVERNTDNEAVVALSVLQLERVKNALLGGAIVTKGAGIQAALATASLVAVGVFYAGYFQGMFGPTEAPRGYTRRKACWPWS